MNDEKNKTFPPSFPEEENQKEESRSPEGQKSRETNQENKEKAGRADREDSPGNSLSSFGDAYEKAMNEIIETDDENAKDNLSDYMDELKEESEALDQPVSIRQLHPNRVVRGHQRHEPRH